MLPPPPLVPPGIGVAPGGRASPAAPLSLQEEVRAAKQAARSRRHHSTDRREPAPEPREIAIDRSRVVAMDVDRVLAPPKREYASDRSRDVDMMDVDRAPANASQPPHLRASPAEPNGLPRINVPVRAVAPDRPGGAEREFASERTRATLKQEALQRDHANERSRLADRGSHAAAAAESRASTAGRKAWQMCTHSRHARSVPAATGPAQRRK